ncbi:MAG: hypothetical protein JW791_05325 [Nanoarchaeota archaeon]|nr:hypothetical protein [Nanoarchaeota archaeon]
MIKTPDPKIICRELQLLKEINNKYAEGFFTERFIKVDDCNKHEWMGYEKGLDNPKKVYIIYGSRLFDFVERDDDFALVVRKSLMKHEVLEAYLDEKSNQLQVHNEANNILKSEVDLPGQAEEFLFEKVPEWNEVKTLIECISRVSGANLEKASDYFFPRAIVK